MTPSPDWDLLWHSATLACMNEGGVAYGLIENGAIAIKDGEIAWIGRVSELPGPQESLAKEVFRDSSLNLAIVGPSHSRESLDDLLTGYMIEN